MIRRILVAFIFVSAGFFAGMVLTGHLRSADESVAAPLSSGVAAPSPQAENRPAGAFTGGLADLSGVAAKTIGSVMNIASLQVTRTPNSPFGNDPLFRYFFGDQDESF